MPPAADSDALNGALNAHEENNKGLRNAEGPSQSPRESVEIGNLTPLPLFELSQIATQSETIRLALSLIIFVKNLNLARHRNTHRLPLQVFC